MCLFIWGLIFILKKMFINTALENLLMIACIQCVQRMYKFRSVKVNGAMTDSQSTEFSLCGFIAVEQGHARGRVVAAAVAPAGPGSSPAAGLGRLGTLACYSCLTHVLPRACFGLTHSKPDAHYERELHGAQ